MTLLNMLKQDLNTSNFEIDRPLPTGKNKKINWTNEKNLEEFVGLRVKTYTI